jgi:hypothetical protein
MCVVCCVLCVCLSVACVCVCVGAGECVGVPGVCLCVGMCVGGGDSIGVGMCVYVVICSMGTVFILVV